MNSLEKNLIFLTFVFACSVTACGPNGVTSSDVSIAANHYRDGSGGVRNIALVVIGDSDGIPGTIVDFRRMPAYFQKLGFVVQTLEYPSAQVLSQRITQIASEMAPADAQALANQQRGGTFALYITSHGGEDGSTSLGGGSYITMSQIAAAAQMGRNGIPFQRFVTMFDTCFSASNNSGLRNANQAMGQNLGFGLDANSAAPDLVGAMANRTMGELSSFRGLYLSSFAWFSSQSNETSNDTDMGGEATLAFTSALDEAISGQPNFGSMFGLANDGNVDPSNPLGVPRSIVSNATLRNIAQRMKAKVTSQVPVICAHPAQTFDDYVVDPPPGSLPALIPNLAGVRNNAQACL